MLCLSSLLPLAFSSLPLQPGPAAADVRTVHAVSLARALPPCLPPLRRLLWSEEWSAAAASAASAAAASASAAASRRRAPLRCRADVHGWSARGSSWATSYATSSRSSPRSTSLTMCDADQNLDKNLLAQGSVEFATVVEAQFEVLGSALHASRAAVYFRRENAATGALEFFPAAVWPTTQGAWVVGEQTPPAVSAPPLPGGTDASSLLPSYPFLESAPSEGDDGHYAAAQMRDGGLSVPLAHGAEVLGVLAVWRDPRAGIQTGVPTGVPTGVQLEGPSGGQAGEPPRVEEKKGQQEVTPMTPGGAPSGSLEPDGSASWWSAAERYQLEQVARTIAVAALLEQHSLKRRRGGREGAEGAEASALEASRDAMAAAANAELQQFLRGSVHQLKSPVSATRTLCKLLLRRLDGDSISKELVKASLTRVSPESHTSLTQVSHKSHTSLTLEPILSHLP